MARAARRSGRQAPGARLLLRLAGAAAPACANIGAPPGGPPDTAPPQVVAVRPESGAVVRDLRGPLVIRFDEVIDEMPGSPGAAFTGLASHILLSPVDGAADVRWARTEIRLRPDEGWRPGRVYRLEIRSGILDLRGNRTDQGRIVLFSTGPPIPDAVLSGTALLWVEQRALAGALIKAARLPDTAAYLAVADSGGEFVVRGLPPGDYVVSALHDQNGNRRRDFREAWDSARVRLDSSATATLFAFVRDTVGPRVRAEFVDSTTIRLVFTQPLDPAAPPVSGAIRVLALPDSTPVPVAAVLSAAAYDSARAAARAAADTQPAARPADVAPGQPGERAGAQAPDTSRARALLARRPVPSDRLVARLGRPLTPEGRYLVRVTGARNLSGVAGDPEALLTVPRAERRDTTRAP